MTKFSFKLQSLLNVKLQLEDNLKNELGKAVQMLEHEKSLLLGLENEMEASMKELKDGYRQKITVERIRKYNLYIEAVLIKIRAQKDKVNNALEYVDKVRNKLLKVVRDRQILEKYKEKKYSDFLLEQARDEQKTNDEITSYRFAKVNA